MTVHFMPVTAVTATSPLTVTLSDGSSHKAKAAGGTTPSTSSGTYVALVQQGSPIIIFAIS